MIGPSRRQPKVGIDMPDARHHKICFGGPSMKPVEKSIAALRREAAVVGLCAVAFFLAGTAIGLAANCNSSGRVSAMRCSRFVWFAD